MAALRGTVWQLSVERCGNRPAIITVNIGVSPTSPGAPHIGNGVYIGPGAKLWNDITIADGVTIGANACVSKSVTEEGAVVVGTNRVL